MYNILTVMKTDNQYVNWFVLIVSVTTMMYMIVAQHNEKVARDNVLRIASEIHQST